MVFIAVTAVIVLLVTLATFNVGQLSYHRIKLQNTVDAATYSAAVAHARELNFSAYMNRGVIANQVAITQIVSITGWMRGYKTTYTGFVAELATFFANFSPLGAMWTVPANMLRSATPQALNVVEQVAGPAITALDFLIDGLGVASDAYHWAMMGAIPLRLVPEVIKANEGSDAGISLVGGVALAASVAKASTFSTTYEPKSQKDGDYRMAYVTQASTDLFYKNRSLPVPFYPIPMLIDPTRLVNPGFGPLLIMNFHSGGSTMKDAPGNVNDHLQGYSSLDATGTFIILCFTLNILGIPIPIPIPLPPLPNGMGAAYAGSSGWGSASALNPFSGNVNHRNGNNSGTDGAALVHYGGAHTLNPMTIIPAWIQTAMGPGTNLRQGVGINNYRDVQGNASGTTSNAANASTGDNKNDVAPAWVLEIERLQGTLITSNTGPYSIGGGTDGQLSLPPAFAGNKLRALARAEAYFSRPKGLFPRDDGKTEWGSLYSPYWQARLQPNGLLEQVGSILGTALF
jgi:hypothetical protein